MDTKYAFYSTSKGYRVVGGTAAHFLKADGSLDSNTYLTLGTPQNITGRKLFLTAGGNAYNNNSLHVFSDDGSNPGMTFWKSGIDIATLSFDGVGNFIFNNSNGSDSKYLIAKGYKKSGSDNNKFLTGSGGDYDARKKEDAWFHSARNFPQGTLIETDVDYSVTSGDQFLLEMKGNMYGGGNPLIANIQGYIYANTLYSVSGYSTLPYWNYIIALNLNGKLCFWFPSLSYWQGFDVKVTIGYGGLDQGRNRVTGVSDSVDPGGTKRFQINLEHLLTKERLNEGFVTLDTTQTITALKQHNANLAIGDSYEFRLKGSADSAHYLKHFSDDTDGFGVSTGFAVKPYNDLNINLFKVDSNGNSFTLETHKTKKLISNYTGTTSGQNLGSGGIGNTLELRNYDLYGTNFWTNDWGDGHIQQQRFDGNSVAYNLKLQPLGGLLYYGNNIVATENQIPDVSNFTTYNFLAQNYALRAGSNATDTWANTSYGLSINPYIPGKTFNTSGACYLQEATYGSTMGYLNSSGTSSGNPTNDWWFRLKMLHSNSNGYYGEIGVKMTGGTNSLRYKRFENGVDSGWVEVWDKQNLTQGNINNWNFAYNSILSDVLNFNNNEGDYTRYYKLDGSSFDRLRIGTGIVDTRVMGNGLDSDGSSTFVPNSGNKALNHKLLPLFHEVSGRGYQSSLILKGWTDKYRAWRITGPADVSNKEEDFFLSQTNSDTGRWMKERKIWTDKHFTQANINSWNNYVSSSGIQLNVEFTTNTGAGLVITDDSGGYSGMTDNTYKRFISGKQNEYYKYGSLNSYFDGLNFNLSTSLFGMGREANKNDKLTVEGSVKASKNFKSEEEKPDTIFIPNGRTADLRDEIINDESDYAIRLDPHEYDIDAYTTLQVDDRNRLIHIIGEQVEMGVNFNKIYPKQQIVIYNFDQKGNSMEVQIYGNTRYKIEPRCFLRLYVTKSLRVIAERQQPCDFIW